LLDTDPDQGIAYLEYLGGEKYKVEYAAVIDYCQNTTWDKKVEDLTAFSLQMWAAGKLTTKAFNIAGKGVQTVLDSELAQKFSTAIKNNLSGLLAGGFDTEAALENIFSEAGAVMPDSLVDLVRADPAKVGNNLVGGLEKVANHQLIIGIVDATGTVWDNIKITQPFYTNTKIPKSFELHLKNDKFWVHPNATEHMADYIVRKVSSRMLINSQTLLTSFETAVEKSIELGITYGEPITIGNWEFIFSSPRQEGLLPVIYHAMFDPKRK